jgi:hypothetical protein
MEDTAGSRRVREARLHDTRHTAATMLLMLNVPSRMVMDLMGWSQLSMTQCYQHVPDQLRRDVADKLGHLLWSTDDSDHASDHLDHPSLRWTETQTETPEICTERYTL